MVLMRDLMFGNKLDKHLLTPISYESWSGHLNSFILPNVGISGMS